ncbi:uncharacterized protein DDB_G0272718-like [Uranotaenia lowii]|uniref:uncharacterized protein DDB_G0272718-like n=1 Tax=Uranotaenia lowii TaxID=190385 RepID=UPI00247A2424|nr:uncharacterized protein DDB_G0272718-like [Uranotaenia lowii]
MFKLIVLASLIVIATASPAPGIIASPISYGHHVSYHSPIVKSYVPVVKSYPVYKSIPVVHSVPVVKSYVASPIIYSGHHHAHHHHH